MFCSFSVQAAVPVVTEGVSSDVTMDEDATPALFSLTLNATDADSHPLTWRISSSAANGTASVDTGSGASQAINYSPTLNYNGSDTFIVEVSDGLGGITTHDVNVTINPVNDAPAITNTANASAPINTLYSYIPAVDDPDVGD
ncbi:MAG: Ig-like domain-containing protein, partial [Methylococcales bacterium]